MTDETPQWDAPETWPVARSADLHRDGWVMSLRADWITHPDATGEEPFKRLVLEHPGAAVVLAVDGTGDDERVLVVSQYRHPARRRFVELPAGLIDHAGEDPLDVAKRELREETAHEASEWRHLLSTYASPGISEEVHHIYLARGLTETDRGDFVLQHEEADMGLHWVAYADLLDAVIDGRAADGPLVQAVLAYDVLRRRAGA